MFHCCRRLRFGAAVLQRAMRSAESPGDLVRSDSSVAGPSPRRPEQGSDALEVFTARFSNRDGSTDTWELGAFPCEEAALQEARAALYVSLSAVAVDLYRGEAQVSRVGRDPPRYAAPAAAAD